ncbi:MAG: N-acetylmuramoyl-L-alanine amidase [Nibricoccus sp.]
MLIRTLTCLLLGLEGGALLANPGRSSPTRPASVVDQPKPAPVLKTADQSTSEPTVTVNKVVNFVPIAELAARYSLESSWIEPQRRLLLKNETHQLEIEGGSRDMRFDGLRIFLGEPARFVDGQLQVSQIDAERLLAGLFGPAVAGGTDIKVIAIDPGHGGPDTGTQNAALGLQEKVFALDVSIRLKRIFEAMGYRVVMTRETDIDVGKGARTIIANQAKADVFVSIHFNSVLNDTKTSGVEVFTFAPQFQRSTNAWGKGQPDDTEALPAPVNRFDALSAACAHAIHGALLKSLQTEDRGQKIGHWAALRALNCPGVLVEAGFLSNENEGKKIATPEYRQQIAAAIADGVKAYAITLTAAKR